jgi:Tfp pilus assembly protein PilN
MKSLRQVDFLRHSRWRWPGVVSLVVVALALAWQVYSAFQIGQALTRERQALAVMTSKTIAAARVASMTPQDRRRHAQIEAVAIQLSVPWDQLLSIVEQRAKGATKLLRLEQDSGTGQLKLSAQAPNTAIMMDYVISLEADPMLQGVRLRSHEAKRGEPMAPVQFEVVATWRAIEPKQAEAEDSGTPRSSEVAR